MQNDVTLVRCCLTGFLKKQLYTTRGLIRYFDLLTQSIYLTPKYNLNCGFKKLNSKIHNSNGWEVSDIFVELGWGVDEGSM